MFVIVVFQYFCVLWIWSDDPIARHMFFSRGGLGLYVTPSPISGPETQCCLGNHWRRTWRWTKYQFSVILATLRSVYATWNCISILNSGRPPPYVIVQGRFETPRNPKGLVRSYNNLNKTSETLIKSLCLCNSQNSYGMCDFHAYCLFSLFAEPVSALETETAAYTHRV